MRLDRILSVKNCSEKCQTGNGCSASTVNTPLRWIFRNVLGKASHSYRTTCEHSELAWEQRITQYKRDQQRHCFVFPLTGAVHLCVRCTAWGHRCQGYNHPQVFIQGDLWRNESEWEWRWNGAGETVWRKYKWWTTVDQFLIPSAPCWTHMLEQSFGFVWGCWWN